MSEILFADDDPAMRSMVADILRAAGHQVRLAENGSQALDIIGRTPPDLVVLDYRMGRPDGLEVCRRIKSDPRTAYLPTLILTAESEIDERIRGFEAGANDYLPKPFDARELLARVESLLRLASQSLDRNPTSGLPGGEAIEREFYRRVATGGPLSITYFDLDHFKPFADRFGFAVADEVLREAADALSSAASGADAFLGHVGGDDFIVLADSADGRPLAERAQAHFRRSLQRHLPGNVVEEGRYLGISREGMERTFPLTRLSAAILHLPRGWRGSLRDLGEELATIKRLVKSDEQSPGLLEMAVEAPRG